MSEKQVASLYRWVIGILLSLASVFGGLVLNTVLKTQDDVSIIKVSIGVAVTDVQRNKDDIRLLYEWKEKISDNRTYVEPRDKNQFNQN